MNTKPTMDAVLEKYVATRNEIKALEAELEEKLKPLKEFQEAREMYMLGLLQESGAQNMKTKHGTCYILTKESVTMGDWDAFENWAISSPLAKALDAVDIPVEVKNDIFVQFKNLAHTEFLMHGVAKTPVLDLMKEGNPPPAGINYTSIKTVGVRKA